MSVEQAKRLKEVERENARLCKAIADLTLDKLILEKAGKENLCALYTGAAVSRRWRSVWEYQNEGRARRCTSTGRCSAGCLESSRMKQP